MTNFEKLLPSIQILFGKSWDWTPELFAELYQNAMDVYDCSDICPVGGDNCTRRMGVKPYSECESEEEWEDSWDNNNGKKCVDILTEWLNEEADEES